MFNKLFVILLISCHGLWSMDEGLAISAVSYTVANNSLLGCMLSLFNGDHDLAHQFMRGALLHSKLYATSGELKSRDGKDKQKERMDVWSLKAAEKLYKQLKNPQVVSARLNLDHLIALGCLAQREHNNKENRKFEWPQTIKVTADQHDRDAEYQFFFNQGRIVCAGVIKDLTPEDARRV